MCITKRVVIAFSVLFVLAGPVDSSHEFQITTDPHNQLCPAIYQDVVVWQDARNGNWDIYGYTLSTNKEFQITTDPDDQKNPAIYKDYVVWQDDRNGNWDIYGYNLLTKKEFRITMDSSNQHSPAIHQSYVVWQDERHVTNSNIYGYNLVTKEEWRITKNTRDQLSPAIHEDIIIWIDKRDNKEMYGYNLSTNQEFRICTIHDDSIAIYKEVVVWRERIYGDFYICVYNLITKKKSEIKASYSVHDLKISNYIIVWSDERNRALDDDIFGYNIVTHEELQIATHAKNQWWPALSNDIAVWADNRNGNWDIYGVTISGVPTTVVHPRPPYEYVYALLVVFSAISALFIVEKGIPYVNSKKLHGLTEPKDFKRNHAHSTLLIVFALFWALYGWFIINHRGHLYGFFWPFLSFLWFIGFFWSRKTPYIRVTDDEIMLFTTLLKKPEVVPFDTIKKVMVNLERKIIDLQRSDNSILRINLSILDKKGKNELVIIVSNRITEKGGGER